MAEARLPGVKVDRRKFVKLGTFGAAVVAAPIAYGQEGNSTALGASAVEGSGSSQIDRPAGLDSESFRLAVPGAITRNLSEKLADAISVKDFGAVGNGIVDDTEAVQAAVSTGRAVLIPKGIYRLTRTIKAGAVIIHGEGAQSVLLFDSIGANVNGIEFVPQVAEQTSGCSSVAILIRGTDGGAAIKTPHNEQQYEPLRSKFHFYNLLIAGAEKASAQGSSAFETRNGWRVGLDQGDAWQVEVYEVDGYSTYRSDSDPTSQLKSVFIRLNAARTMMTARIGGITCSNWYRGIEVGDRCFFQIQQFDIAHAFDGVFQTAGAGAAFGESKLLNGNINAQHVGVYFAGVSTREISGVVVRRHSFGWKGARYNWHGFRLEHCSGVWLSNSMAQPDESKGKFNGTQYGISLLACSSVSINGFLVGSTCHRGVLADNCVMLALDNVMTWQAGAQTDIVYRLKNNTRNSVIGAITLVSTFAGTLYSDDGTIGGTVTFNQRDFSPSGTMPYYSWRRTSNGKDEKIWKAVQGASTWGLMTVDDNESKNVNAMLFTRSGTDIVSCDLRASETITSNLRPNSDGVRGLGSAAYRWGQVFLSTAAISTSDERAKESIGGIDDKVLDAWAEVEYFKYKFKESVAVKEQNARWHFGVLAQKVKSVFERHGLDAFSYGLLCFDEWHYEAEVDPLDRGKSSPVTMPELADEGSPASLNAGSRYGIRYEEALVLEAALMRRATNRLEARIKALEPKATT